MESKSIYEILWVKGIQPEIVDFLEGLNWSFIFMFIVILYGLKHTNHFVWFDRLLEKIKIQKYRVWVAVFITGTVFCFFKWQEDSINWSYISTLMRSIFFGVVFSNVFVDIPVFLIKKLGVIIDNKKENIQPATRRKKKIN